MARYLVEILIAGKDLASGELKKVKDQAGELDKALKVTAATAAGIGIAVATGLAVAAREGAKYADSLTDVSERTGFALSTTAALTLELEKAGGSMASLDVVARTLSRTMEAAISGEDQAVKTFEKLGISLEQLIGPDGGLKSVEDILPLIADGLSRVDSASTRTAVGVELLGRGSLTLVPILSQGAAGLAKLREESERLSGGLDPEKVLNAGALDDSLKNLQQSVRGFQVTIADRAGLDRFTDGLTQEVAAANRFIQEHEAMSKVIGLVGASIAGGGGLIVLFYALGKALEKAAAAGFSAGVAMRQLATASTFIAAAAAAAYLLDKAFNAEKDATEALDAATKGFVDTLQNEKSTSDDLRRAHEALEKARRDSALASGERQFLDPTRPQTGAAESTNIPVSVAQKDVDAVEERIKELSGRIERDLGLVVPTSVDVPALLSQIQTAKREAQATVDDGIAIQLRIRRGEATGQEIIAAQREIVAGLQRAQSDKSAKLDLAFRAGSTEGVANAQKELEESTKKLTDARLKLVDTEKEVARTVEDETRAFRDLEAAQDEIVALKGDLDLSEQIDRSRAAVVRLEQSLLSERAAVDTTTAGTGLRAEALERLQGTTTTYIATLQELQALEARDAERQEQMRQSIANREQALLQLERAQKRLEAIQTIDDSGERAASLAAMDLANAINDVAVARANLQLVIASGPTPEAEAAAVSQLTAATDEYTSALESVRAAQEQTGESGQAFGAVISGVTGTLTGLLSSIGEGAINMAAVFKRAIIGIISDLVRLAIQAATTKKVVAAVGGLSFGPIGLLGVIGAAIPGQTGFEVGRVGMAGGGVILGGIRGKDTINASLGGGELVVDHRTTDELKQFLRFTRASTSPQMQRALSGGAASRGGESRALSEIAGLLKGLRAPSGDMTSPTTVVNLQYRPSYSVASRAEERRLMSDLAYGLQDFGAGAVGASSYGD